VEQPVDRLEVQETGTRAVSDPSPADGAANAVVAEAKLNYLRMMTMTLLSELNSLQHTGREPSGIDLKTEVLHFESELIRSALCTTKGQQRRAAHLLGTNATTLNTKLKRLKIWIDEPSLPDLPEASGDLDVDENGDVLTFAEAMHRYEITLIQHALIQTGGNQSKAARLLGLPITTLNSKLRKLKIDVPRYFSNPTAGAVFSRQEEIRGHHRRSHRAA
jgi:DNA-binding NtrC family response regulator